MKKLLFVFALLGLFAFTAQDVALKKKSIDGKIKMLVPKSFRHLNADKEQPASENPLGQFMNRAEPLALFANDDESITLSIQETVEPGSKSRSNKKLEVEKQMGTQRDLETERKFKKASFETYFENVRFLRDEVTTINGNQFIVFEMEAKLAGENSKGEKIVSYRYIYMLYGYKGNSSYSINFSCPLDQKREWQVAAQQMMESVQL